jgi:hypothetical protein
MNNIKEINAVIVSRRIWLVAFLMILAAVAGLVEPCKGQFTIVTNSGAIIITGYTGTDGSVIIPASTNGYPITGITTNVFLDDTYVTNLVVPAGVGYIGTNSFAHCANLSSITVPGAMTNESSLGGKPFNSVFLGDPITNISIAPGSTYIISNAFASFSPLGVSHGSNITVFIPSGVTNIEFAAFNDCIYLTNITFPETLLYIGPYAFGEDTRLNPITIPASVTNLDLQAFGTCIQLANVILEGGTLAIGPYAFYSCADLTNLTVEAAITTIGSNAFANCASLQNLVLTNGINSIGNGAFANCTALTNVNLGNTASFIADYSFSNCPSLLTVTVPGAVNDGVVHSPFGPYHFIFSGSVTPIVSIAEGSAFITSNAFAVMGITSVTIPSSVTNIEYRAFYDNQYLTAVAIPPSVTTIGSFAFEACLSLADLSLPNGLMNIGANAFDTCAMTSVAIPASVTNLGSGAFAQTSLGQVYFLGNAPDTGTNTTVFSGDSAGVTAYHLPGTTGWGPMYDGLPTALWNPQATAFSTSGGQFGFNITGPTNATIEVLACTNLVNPVWLPVATNTLSASGTSVFSDPQWMNYSNRYYRFSAP